MKIFLLMAVIIFVASLAACSKPASVSPPTDSTVAAPAAFSHKAFDELLNTYVDENGWVDYAGLKKDRAKLDQYLATCAAAQPKTFPSQTDQLAFWINGYNAFVLADVLDKVYGKAKSVQEVKDFFAQKTHKIAGETLSLKEIENRGRDLKDPRLHFAMNGASASCPRLQRFAYNGTQLDLQLTKAGREFLGDINRGMNYDPGRNVVYLSPIFQWYAADFSAANAASPSGEEMLEAAKKYVPANVAQFLTEKKMKVEWHKYDWSLNAQETHR